MAVYYATETDGNSLEHHGIKEEAAFVSDSEKAKGEEIYQRLLNAYADILIAKEKEENQKEEREKVLAKAS